MAAPLLCLDVGGTELKGAPVDGGTLLAPLRHFPARSGEDRETLLDHFAAVFRELDAAAGTPPVLGGLRLAFPGPFDYEKGICLLQGLDKYDALYEVNLRDELYARLRDRLASSQDIRFINDVAAFALGEMHYGSAAGSERSLSVCIGTGCGSAFGVGGMLAPEGTPNVPAGGYIYPAPFLDSCIDDHISKRGLMALCAQRLGRPLEGAQLAALCEQGDPAALACFEEFGTRLADALDPFCRGSTPSVSAWAGRSPAASPSSAGRWPGAVPGWMFPCMSPPIPRCGRCRGFAACDFSPPQKAKKPEGQPPRAVPSGFVFVQLSRRRDSSMRRYSVPASMTIPVPWASLKFHHRAA